MTASYTDGYVFAGDPPQFGPSSDGYRLDLVIVRSRVAVRLAEFGGAQIEVVINAPTTGGWMAMDLRFHRFEPRWSEMSELERDRAVFDAVAWMLQHELAEKLTRDGLRVVEPHPTASTAFPDVQRWRAEKP